ncbi:MAG: hypothetical protein ACRDD1_09710 [Planctomycetia bacterium]
MAAGKIKFPYTLNCPQCLKGLRVKSEAMLGKRLSCPSCGKKVDIVPPDEDATVSYGVEAPPPPEKPHEPSEEEIEEKEEEERKKTREKTVARTMDVLSTLWYIVMVVAAFGIIYYFVYVQGYSKPVEEKQHWQEPT